MGILIKITKLFMTQFIKIVSKKCIIDFIILCIILCIIMCIIMCIVLCIVRPCVCNFQGCKNVERFFFSFQLSLSTKTKLILSIRHSLIFNAILLCGMAPMSQFKRVLINSPNAETVWEKWKS